MAPQQVVGQAEGYRTVSWIWMMEGAFDKADKKEMEGGMYTSHRFACWLISSLVIHVEWLKSWAHVHRWREEVSLMKAEMEHSLISLEYYASKWESQWDQGESLAGARQVTEGRTAYVNSQAAVFHSLAEHFKTMWSKPWVESMQHARNMEEAEAMEEEKEEETVADATINEPDAVDNV